MIINHEEYSNNYAIKTKHITKIYNSLINMIISSAIFLRFRHGPFSSVSFHGNLEGGAR
jgi:hypothetical protein